MSINLNGRSILITGGTGSLGKALTRRIFSEFPEVSRIVSESAEGVRQINENITQVSTAATETGKNAMNAQEASKKLTELASTLFELVEKVEI